MKNVPKHEGVKNDDKDEDDDYENGDDKNNDNDDENDEYCIRARIKVRGGGEGRLLKHLAESCD